MPEVSFAGSVPENYERYMVPMLMKPYADDLVGRLPAGKVSDVLELACGTGVVTRALVERFVPGVGLTATDLSPAMVEIAKSTVPQDRVSFGVADAQELNFPVNSFDYVLCQFGMMFVPDKVKAYREVLRVLRPGGQYWFLTWLPIEDNPIAEFVHEQIQGKLGTDETFICIPHGMFDEGEINSDLELAGFVDVRFERLMKRARAGSAADVVRGFIFGSPAYPTLKDAGVDLEAFYEESLGRAKKQFGEGPVDTEMGALLVQATKRQ